jgi:protein-S-isoprenylcysteine O-methyltransferase Ste14
MLRERLQEAIRPSVTRSGVALWAKSALNGVIFFAIFMLALPWLFDRLLPLALPVPGNLRTWIAAVLAGTGIAAWIACLDVFSRKGMGTPLPADAPRRLVVSGLFARSRNPIMSAELLVIWAEVLYVGSLGVGLYAVVISALAHASVVYVEEPELRRRFGQAYEDYCGSVPRWLPRLRAAQTRNPIAP